MRLMISARSSPSTSRLIVGRPIKRALCVDTLSVEPYNVLSPAPLFSPVDRRTPRDRIWQVYGREGGPHQPRMPEEPGRLRDDAGAIEDEWLRADDGRGGRG